MNVKLKLGKLEVRNEFEDAGRHTWEDIKSINKINVNLNTTVFIRQ